MFSAVKFGLRVNSFALEAFFPNPINLQNLYRLESVRIWTTKDCLFYGTNTNQAIFHSSRILKRRNVHLISEKMRDGDQDLIFIVMVANFFCLVFYPWVWEFGSEIYQFTLPRKITRWFQATWPSKLPRKGRR